jgi:hypothetical protein
MTKNMKNNRGKTSSLAGLQIEVRIIESAKMPKKNLTAMPREN